MTVPRLPPLPEAAREALRSVREGLGRLAGDLMCAYDALGEGQDARPGLLDALDRLGDLAARIDVLERLLGDGRADP